jgi:hypothetical protein
MICQITVISQTQFSDPPLRLTYHMYTTDHVYTPRPPAHGPGVWSLQLTSERVPVGRMALSELARPRLTAADELRSELPVSSPAPVRLRPERRPTRSVKLLAIYTIQFTQSVPSLSLRKSSFHEAERDNSLFA